jgi:hypothetical protein
MPRKKMQRPTKDRGARSGVLEHLKVKRKVGLSQRARVL